MKVQNHHDALDEHSRLLGSLSPITHTDKELRKTMVVSPLLDTLDKNAIERIHGAIKLTDTRLIDAAQKMIDSYFGKGYVDHEIASYIAAEISSLRQAQTIFCSSDIVDEISEAKETMLDNIILAQDLFVEDGLIVLEKPYCYRNLTHLSDLKTWQCEEFEVKMILFTKTSHRADTEGIAVQLYGYVSAIHFFESQEEPEYPYANPDYSYVYKHDIDEVSFIAHEDDYSNLERFEPELYRLMKNMYSKAPQLVDGTFFSFGEQNTEYDPEVLELKRFLLAFFRLTYEYLEVNNEKPERPFQKRAKRAGHSIPQDGYITVMTLRRKLYGESENTETRSGPSYAFRVRGHWKKAYMASRKLPVGDPGAYRHVYVKDCIKGRGLVVRSKRVVKVGN